MVMDLSYHVVASKKGKKSCSNGVPTVFQQCFNGVPTVFQQCANGVPTVSQQCSSTTGIWKNFELYITGTVT